MTKGKNLLKSKIKEITASGLPFMEGRTQLDVDKILGQTVTVEEYGYLRGDNGDYVVLVLEEYPQFFMYGASVVTQAFKELDEMLTPKEKEEVLKEGLTFSIEERKSKNKFTYHKITFFPDDEE